MLICSRVYLSLAILATSLWAQAFRLELARNFSAEGKFSEAIREYRLYLEQMPKDAKVYEEMGRLYLTQKLYRQAILNFQMALVHDKDRLSAQQGIALAHELAGEDSRAILEWRKLATLTPNISQKEEAEQHIQDILKSIKRKQADLVERAKSIDTIKSAREKKEEVNKIPFYLRKENQDVTDTALLNELGARLNTKKKKDTVSIQNKNLDTGSSISSSPLSARLRLARKPLGLDSKEAAALAAEEKILKSPPYKDARYLRALDLKEKGKTEEALDLFRVLLNAYPDHAGAYFHAGEIRYQQGNYELALYNLERGKIAPKKGPHAFYYLGKIHAHQKKKNEAQYNFTRYAQLVHEGKKREEAVAYLTKAGIAPPVIPPKPVPALQTWKNVVRHKIGFGLSLYISDSLHPGSSELKQALAHYKEGRLETCLDIYRDIMETYPGGLSAHLALLNLSHLYMRMGLFKEAEQKIIDLPFPQEEPWLSQADWMSALINRQAGQFKLAQEYLTLVTPNEKWGPLQEDKTQLQAELWVKLGKIKEALLAYRELRLLHKNDSTKVRTDLLVARFLNEQGQLDESLKYYSRAAETCKLKKYKVCPDVWVQYADLNMRGGKTTNALSFYELMIKNYPDHPETAWSLYQVGNIYSQSGKAREALEAFSKVFEKFPRSYWATQARWKQEELVWRKKYGEVFH